MTCFKYLQIAKTINNNESVNRLLLIQQLKKDITWLYANLETKIDNLLSLATYLQLVKKYADGYPLAYITGYVFFLGYELKVNKNVLIPRTATEELVKRALKYCQIHFKKHQKVTMLDLGTGSGCIAISFANAFPDYKITAIDISSKALLVAKSNCAKYKLNNITFIESDCFDNIDQAKFAVIIANPPYIDKNSKSYLPNQLQHEPALALFAKNNGLAIYEKIFLSLEKHLNEHFFVAFEIGFDQKATISKLLVHLPKKIIWWYEKDYENHDRYLFLKNNI